MSSCVRPILTLSHPPPGSRQLKKQEPGTLPDLYLAAMQQSYKRCAELAVDGDADRAEAQQADFLTLCTRISGTYAGFNASGPSMERIAAGGIRHALRDVPRNLAFLEVSVLPHSCEIAVFLHFADFPPEGRA